MRVLGCGQTAVLLEFGGDEARAADRVRTWLARAEAGRPAAVTDLVPGARTVLVCFDPARTAAPAIRDWATSLDTADTAAPAGRAGTESAEPIEVPVDYDGPDLAVVADHLGLSIAGVIAAHQRAVWRCVFTGFAPGFGYLRTDDLGWSLPRRATPRTRVPAGAVGLAGPYGGVYPRATAGGWQLIGTTDADLWDPAADPPALIRPGSTVRFTAR